MNDNKHCLSQKKLSEIWANKICYLEVIPENVRGNKNKVFNLHF